MPHPEDPQNTIPVIDISNPSDEVAQQVLCAASTHGFLYIKNDGVTIPPQDIDDMFKLSKQFFASPNEEKAEYTIHSEKAGGVNRGWVQMQGESLDPSGSKPDPKEAFNISPTPPLQPLPHPLSSHSSLISRFQTQCHTLCTNILSLLNTALHIPDPSYLPNAHNLESGPSGSIFRMLYYPPSPHHHQKGKEGEEEGGIRAGAHSDYGSLTLLFRLPGQPGLELLTPSGWMPVPVHPHHPTTSSSSSSSSADNDDPPPILVNIGDLLCYWTSGFLKSTVHRVTFSGGEERYSMAYFCHPGDGVVVDGVESEVVRGFRERDGGEEMKRQRERLGLGEQGEEGLTAGKHLERRLRVTYGL